jgi:hypothetical protein
VVPFPCGSLRAFSGPLEALPLGGTRRSASGRRLAEASKCTSGFDAKARHEGRRQVGAEVGPDSTRKPGPWRPWPRPAVA